MNTDLELFQDSPYEYNGVKVPRVTHILHEMLHSDSLMNWAHRMGKAGSDIDNIKNIAADKGTIVHSMCEFFLRYRLYPYNCSEIEIPHKFKRDCLNAFSSFVMWISNLDRNGLFWKPLMLEQPLICELFGGTMDCLLEVAGKIYIIDFKTSNFLNCNYCLQLAAYRYMLRLLYGIEVDGCLLLRLEKKRRNEFPEEMMFDMHNPDELEFMKQCEAMFLNIANAYWQRAIVEQQYKCLTGNRF